MIKLAMSIIGGLAGGVGKGAMGLLGGLGLGKIQLIILAFLIATIVGQGVAIKFIYGAKERAVAGAAAEQVAHEVTKQSFLVYKRETDRNQENQLKATAELSAARNAAQKERDSLSKILRKHDLGHLARKKPGLIERRINRATEEAFKKISGPTWPSPPQPRGVWWNPWTEPKRRLDYETEWFIEHIERFGHPCWLLYSSYRTPDSLFGPCRFAPRIPPSTAPYSCPSCISGIGGGTRGDVWRNNQAKPGADLSKPAPVRKPRRKCRRPHCLFA